MNTETKGPKETSSNGTRFTHYIKNLVDQEVQFSKSIKYYGRTKEFPISGYAAALLISRRIKNYNFVSNFIFLSVSKKWQKLAQKSQQKENCNLQVYFNYISESFSTCYRRYLHLVHVLVFYLQNKIFCPSIHVECLCVHINFIIGSKEKDVKGIRSRWCW